MIDSLQHEAGQIKATIQIEATHEILKGHFPSQAVVPGVCMLEMLREVLEQALKIRLQLESSQTIKFLAMFVPSQHTQAEFVIRYILKEFGNYVIEASLFQDDTIFMKCKTIFTTKN